MKRFFSSPVFPEDADKAISASMVYYGIIFGLIANLLIIPALILSGDPSSRIILTSSFLVASLFVNLCFLRRGYVQGAGAIFLLTAWIGLTMNNYTAGGVRAPGFMINVVVIICVAFIFGKRWAFMAAALGTAIGALFVVLETRGLLPPPQVQNTPTRYWLISTANYFVIAAILTMMVNLLRKAIAEGRRELIVRRETERKLERHQAALEGTVRERTAALGDTNTALLQEVHERRLVEESLRREKDFIGQLMETSPVGIMVTDSEGCFTFANAAAANILGRRREEIVGLSCTAADWGFSNYDGLPIVAADLPFSVILTSGLTVRNAPLSVVTPEGKRVLLSLNCDTLAGDQGNPGGSVITVEDVTERVRLEQEMFRTQKLESVGVLAGGIAHDFNNLLTGIMGNISLARMDLPSQGTVAETLADAEAAALQARELTQQLLTFSRGGKPIKQTVALGELLTTAAQFTLRGTNVRAEISIPPDLWAVEADRGQIAQVFHNLVINACQSMPQGGTVRLDAANLSCDTGDGIPLPAGKYVKVSVADGGGGIPPEHLLKIFDPFFSTKAGGTGLGLAIVYSVVRNHGGHVEVKSSVGEGTMFTLLLPASAGVAVVGAPPADFVGGSGNILLMDDEPIVRQVVFRMLGTLGYRVQTAAEGATAVALYRDALAAGKPFDAVILDLTVPGGMGGAETIDRLRAVDPNVRAIVSSGYSSAPVMSNWGASGFNGMIAKPFRAGDLSRVLRQVLTECRESPPPVE